MKKGDFLWSAYRITEKQKAGKAWNIKEKQLKNSRNTASKRPAALRSSASVKFHICAYKIPGVFHGDFLCKKKDTEKIRAFGFRRWRPRGCTCFSIYRQCNNECRYKRD